MILWIWLILQTNKDSVLRKIADLSNCLFKFSASIFSEEQTVLLGKFAVSSEWQKWSNYPI